jgi:hypothetical protein
MSDKFKDLDFDATPLNARPGCRHEPLNGILANA